MCSFRNYGNEEDDAKQVLARYTIVVGKSSYQITEQKKLKIKHTSRCHPGTNEG